MFRRLLLVLSPALLFLLVPLSAALAFTDVGPTSQYSGAIVDLSTRGIISGFEDGTFRPLDNIKRMQFAKIVVRAFELPVSVSDGCPFVDVPGDLDAADPLYPDHYVAICAAQQITVGTNPAQKLFSPNDPIRRAQVITMVVRAADSLYPGLLLTPPAGFHSTWGTFDQTHGANAAKAQYNGLLDWLPLSVLDPYGPMARGEVAQLLHNFLVLVDRASPVHPEQHSLDEVFSVAPTAAEIAAIDGAVKVTFSYDPTASQGASGNLTPLKRRAYQVLQFMKNVRFSEPLPWTSMTMFDWFRDSVEEVRFENGSQAYFSNSVIHVPVQPNSYIYLTDKFMDRQSGGGLMDTFVLLVHEARHAQKPHTDGTNDKTLAELGAWGVQYYTYLYLADKSNYYMDDYTRATLKDDAAWLLKLGNFTQEPH